MVDIQETVLHKNNKPYQLIEGIRHRASDAFKNTEFLKANNLPFASVETAKEEAKEIFLRAENAQPAPTSLNAANYLKTLLDQYDFDTAKQSKKMRSYIVTKLVQFSEDSNKNLALKALDTLGRASEVGLFTTKIDININTKPTEDLEREIHNILKGYNIDVLEGQLLKVEGQLSLEREMLEDAELEGDFVDIDEDDDPIS
jgi:hypothetical protein